MRHLDVFSCLKNKTVYAQKRTDTDYGLVKFMAISRNIFWIAFFASILAAWWWLYSMSLSMNMDLLGRMAMENSMAQMDMPKENMSQMSADGDMAPMKGMNSDDNMNPGQMSEDKQMASMPPKRHMAMDTSMTSFLPLAGMWAVMMAAMMLPTMVPTLRSYEDLMVSADGTRIGWLGVLLGYSLIWVIFSLIITIVQMVLLNFSIVDMMGKAKSLWVSAALLIFAGAFQFTRAKEVCHGVCHSPMSYFVGYWKTVLMVVYVWG